MNSPSSSQSGDCTVRSMSLPRWITEQEIADNTGASLFTVRRWRKFGGLKARKLGRSYKIREDWYLAWQEDSSESVKLEGLESSGCRSDQIGRIGTSHGSTSGPTKLDERRRAQAILNKPNAC